MTLDIPSTLVVVAVGGYTSFRSFVFFSHSQFDAYNGEKLILKSLQLGILSAIPLLLFVPESVTLTKDDNLESLARVFGLWILLYLLVCVFIGALYAKISEYLRREQKELVDSYRFRESPRYSNELEKYLLHLLLPKNIHSKIDNPENTNNSQQSPNSSLIRYSFVELDDKKVYLGCLKSVDLNDDMPLEERFVIFVPFYSGRRLDTGEIKVTTDYLEAIDNLLYEAFKNSKTVKEEDVIPVAIKGITPIVFSQKNISTLREYDEEMGNKFNLLPVK